MIWVEFVDASTRDELWAMACDAAPSKGEIICFTFAPIDKGSWSGDAWDHHRSLHGRAWIVTAVAHSLSVRNIGTWKQCVTCFLQAAPSVIAMGKQNPDMDA